MGAQAALRALAEPRRQAILRLLRHEPRSVSDICAHVDVSQQAVSQHLQVLAEAGLVTVRPEGRQRLYAIDPRGLAALEAFLAGLWPAGLDRLKHAVERKRGR
jgi:DNA-binding transcriptional ArsR family regulator